MKKLLLVVDYQKDFVDGSLGFSGAEQLEGPICEKIEACRAQGAEVAFTFDTHKENYLETQEGKNLPVPHCIRGTWGWELEPQVEAVRTSTPIEKPSFGSKGLADVLKARNTYDSPLEEIQLVGVCTDICVISNALLLKAFLPETEIAVDAACCAGVTPESHRTALNAMKACQITIENESGSEHK